MSWNLIIGKYGGSPQEGAPLGNVETVTGIFRAAFPDLLWSSPLESSLEVYRGFRLDFYEKNGIVEFVSTSGGYDHLYRFADICKSEGWYIADCQEDEELDLDDPYQFYKDLETRRRNPPSETDSPD